MEVAKPSLALRIRGLFKRPFGLGRGFYIAALLGAFAPLSIQLWLRFMPLGFLYRFPAFDIACILWLFALGATLYWLCGSLPSWKVSGSVVLSLLLFLIGLFGQAWCFRAHLCMAGHMQHPPYPFWHTIIDFGWAGFILFPAVIMRFGRSPYCIALAFLGVFMIAFRFVFGSFGGHFYYLPL